MANTHKDLDLAGECLAAARAAIFSDGGEVCPFQLRAKVLVESCRIAMRSSKVSGVHCIRAHLCYAHVIACKPLINIRYP